VVELCSLPALAGVGLSQQGRLAQAALAVATMLSSVGDSAALIRLYQFAVCTDFTGADGARPAGFQYFVGQACFLL